MAVPGERPTSPVIVLDPVFVTVDPASTAKGLAASRFTVAVAPNAGLIPKEAVRIPAAIAEIANREKTSLSEAPSMLGTNFPEFYGKISSDDWY